MKFEIGKYKGKLIASGVAVLDNAKQTPYIYLTFEILGQIRNGEFIDVEPASRDVRFFVSEKALPYTEKHLVKLGFNGDYENPEFFEKLYTDGIELFCEEQFNDGNTYENWSIVGLSGQAEKKPADKNLLKKLNAQFKAHGHSSYAEQPSQSAQDTQAASTAILDQDIPF